MILLAVIAVFVLVGAALMALDAYLSRPVRIEREDYYYLESPLWKERRQR